MNGLRRPLGRNVIALTAVSFFTDVSSEMIYPLLPVFLTSTLGASAGMLGLIEGAAESTASLLKLASGWWSDRVRRRKPLVVFGYTLASFTRPLVAAAQSASQVLAIRLVDRVGKGIRNSPRDALIADSVDPAARGRAFGFHRAGDNAGGVVGPLVAFAMMQWFGLGMRTVFWLAVIPAVFAVFTVIVFVQESRHDTRPDGGADSGADGGANGGADGSTVVLPRSFWAYLGVLLIFTLGNSTDAFLLLRANQLGVPVALAPILWMTLNLVKSLSSTHGSGLSDRIGRMPTLLMGWGVYALVYLGFAFASAAWHAWALFCAYGLFFALTEGTERALVADYVPAVRRGTAFGWFNLTVGLGMLPASLLFGLVWDRLGAHGAFIMGAALAGLAAAGLAFVPRPARS
ncbi:MAG TPA: MFS transporter [Gemmatimonadaceae bacterium]|nr:MFS transporter [Gemmatimonadaceae bacterium]